MIADEYFDMRSRVGAALFALGRLGDIAGVQPSPAQTVNSIVGGLKDPYIFVVAGEVNAGKSTLLNALFGEEFCPAHALPTTDRIHYFRHGFGKQEIDHSPALREIRLPHAFLHDFHVVDTPGVNSVVAGHQIISEQFIPRADVVLYVLPAPNPWGAQAWDFLGRIHEQWRKKVVIVLQQMDLRSAEEVTAIVDHIEYWMKKRFGGAFPIFPVSARKALLARTSGVDKDKLFAESRFAALEAHLAEIVGSSKPRLEKLRNAMRAGQGLLVETAARLTDHSRRLADEGEVLRRVEQSIAETQPALREKSAPAVHAVNADYTKIVELAAAEVEKEVGARSLIFSSNTASRAAEKAGEIIGSKLTASVDTHFPQVLSAIESDLEAQWQRLEPDMRQVMGTKSNHTEDEPVFPLPGEQRQMAEFPRQMQGAVQEEMDSFYVETVISPSLVRGRRRILFLLGAVIMGLATAGIGVWQDWPLLWQIGVGVAALGAVLLPISVRFTRLACKAAFEKRAEFKRMELRNNLEETCRQWLPGRLAEFNQRFKPLQDWCGESRQRHEPVLIEIEALKQNFAEVEAALN